MPQLQTQRLVLREFEPSDVEPLFDLYARPETSQFESWDAHLSIGESRELLEHWMARQSDQPRTDYTFAIDIAGEFAGLCGLELGLGTETDDLRAGFVGYRMHPSRWNQGYATEALRAILDFGFNVLHLHRIHSGCAVTNLASIKVLEKGGLKREGTTRESFPIGDQWTDYALFGMVVSEWQ